jgi:hypothetical protein
LSATGHSARKNESTSTAFIHLTIPRAEIQNVMGPGINELMATIAAQGIAPAPLVVFHCA